MGGPEGRFLKLGATNKRRGSTLRSAIITLGRPHFVMFVDSSLKNYLALKPSEVLDERFLASQALVLTVVLENSVLPTDPSHYKRGLEVVASVPYLDRPSMMRAQQWLTNP